MPLTWIGTKKVVFLPLLRGVGAPAPPNFVELVRQRAVGDLKEFRFLDPSKRPIRVDLSMRNYVRTVSNHVADIDAVFFEPFRVNAIDVFAQENKDAMYAHVRGRLGGTPGIDYFVAAISVDGEIGGGSSALAASWLWRTSLVDSLGTWIMEAVHTITGFWDLYALPPGTSGHLESFDTMATSAGAHMTMFTKQQLGWAAPGAIGTHTAHEATYDLSASSLAQPPTGERKSAISTAGALPHLWVEARRVFDPFEQFISAEGVIVYEVTNLDALPQPELVWPHVYLRTPTPLLAGRSVTVASGTKVTVVAELADGYRIKIERPVDHAQCGRLDAMIAETQAELATETDPFKRRALRALLARYGAEKRDLGC